MRKLMFALMLFAVMLFGTVALAEGIILPDPAFYFGMADEYSSDFISIVFDEYPEAEYDAYKTLLMEKYGMEIIDSGETDFRKYCCMMNKALSDYEVLIDCVMEDDGSYVIKFSYARGITLSALDVYAASAKCDTCGGDGVCDTCEGLGYIVMTAYGSNNLIPVACTGGCAEGKCPVCNAEDRSSVHVQDTKIYDTPTVENGGVLVSTPVEITTFEVTSDSVVVQDMYNYMQNKMSFDPLSTNKSKQTYRSFSGGKDTYSLIKEYVEALTDGSNNFKLVDSVYEAYGNEAFFSFAIDYTGSGPVHGEKVEMLFKNGVYGDITIYGTLKRSSTKGQIIAADGLEFGDLGLRVGGETESVSLPGTSLYADLYRLSDGSYQTGDGRFHVKVGEAAVYRDGEMYTTDATLYRNQGDNREELRIYNFYRNESIALAVPYNSVMTGDILDRSVIGRNDDDNSTDKYMTAMEKFYSWKLGTALMGVCHDGDYFIFYRDDLNNFDDAVVRVMYWDEAADVAVFYICTTFDSAPYEYEAVAAVSLGGTPQGTNADEVFNMQAGKTLDITFSDTEFMPTHELFTWEILEGSSLIELTGARSQTCTIRAYDPGVVRLKVTYEYGAKGANILTGNEETKFLSKTREYVINISPK